MLNQSAGSGPASAQGFGGQLGEMIGLLRANRCGGRLMVLIAALVVVIGATAWYQVQLNAWNKPFYDSLTRKDFPAFLQQLKVFGALALVLLALNVGQLWLDQTLKLTLRRGLFGALLDAWMKPGRADGIARSGLIGENPDQRMQIDTDMLADHTAALGIGLFQSTLLLPALVVVNRLSALPRRLMMFSAVGAVFLFERLAPFIFTGSPGEFDLWPFLGWIETGMPIDPRGLLAFLFFCCALIWLLKEAGIPMDFAVAAVVGGVLVVELLQMWQPHQSASITDPLLALGAGLVLRVLDPAPQRRHLSFK